MRCRPKKPPERLVSEARQDDRQGLSRALRKRDVAARQRSGGRERLVVEFAQRLDGLPFLIDMLLDRFAELL